MLVAAVPQLQLSAVSGNEPDWSVGAYEDPTAGERAMAIEEVALGSRVGTRNPVREDYDLSFPEPDSTWVRLQLEFHHQNGAIVDIDVLRPADWVRRNALSVGSEVTFGQSEIATKGRGRVTSIGPCPPIAEGPGSVVTARFVTRQTSDLVTARFAGGVELTGTRQHPIWSVDRHSWVGLGELLPGESVIGRNGPLAVLSVEDVPGSQPVYNLEVHGEHVYEVTEAGVLVHNNTGADCLELAELQRKLDADGFLEADDTARYMRLLEEGNQNPLKKTQWDFIREWHDKRATALFGNKPGRKLGQREYDKIYRDRDIEYKSDNFRKGRRSQDSLDRMNEQITKDIYNRKKGLANPHWHFEHDPRVAPEMESLLKRLDDAGISWTFGSSAPAF